MSNSAAPPPTSSQRSRGHGEFIRLWESSAPLSDSQLQLCARLEESVGLSDTGRSARSASSSQTLASARPSAEEIGLNDCTGRTYEGADGLRGLASVTTAEEFHAWHAEMERRLEEANDEKFRSILAGLVADHEACTTLLNTVDDASKGLESVKANRALVAETTGVFRADCETLVAERKRMGELADALRRRLTYFEELETLSAKFGGGKDAIAPTHPDFVMLLHRLDECVSYASSSTGSVAEADGYLARFLELQRRAFTAIRDYTVGLIRVTAAQVIKELRDERASGAGFRHGADLTDASKEYLRFRTIASRVKSLMAELHERSKAPASRFLPQHPDSLLGTVGATSFSRSGHDGYAGMTTAGNGTLAGNPLFMTRSAAISLYNDCEECFVDQRKRLLEPSVTAHIKSLGDVRNMIALTRLGSSYVLRICQLERQLYEHFFPLHPGEEESPVLTVALSGICDIFYTELRPQILQESELDKLVYLIEVLKTEVLADEVPRRGAAGTVFAPSAVRAIADAQERIIYRAEVFLSDEIRGFDPLPEHLEYPERILRHNQARLDYIAASRAAFSSSRETDGPLADSEDAGNNGKSEERPLVPDVTVSQGRQDARTVGIYSTWYPPVERTLRLLSMLYRCVDGQVFAGLAQEAVATCVQSVVLAANKIAASGKPYAEDHAQLFLVWQLLMTREQISPFDVEMSYTEHELDFFELRSLLGSVIRGQLSVRSLATPPVVRERVINSKQELDFRVRNACEIFILKTTRAILDPILSFLAKCNAMPARPGHSRPLAPGEVPITPPIAAFDSLKKNKGSFAHPERLRHSWEMVEQAVQDTLPEIVSRMKIYVSKPASRAVLLRPVRSNIAEATSELLNALQSRYTLEERAECGIDGTLIYKLMESVDVAMGFNVSACDNGDLTGSTSHGGSSRL
jgi:conserved oligomeric Golgi complex subunit 3